MFNWIVKTPLSYLATSLTSKILLRTAERSCFNYKKYQLKAFKKRPDLKHLKDFRKLFGKLKIAHLAISFAKKQLFVF